MIAGKGPRLNSAFSSAHTKPGRLSRVMPRGNTAHPQTGMILQFAPLLRPCARLAAFALLASTSALATVVTLDASKDNTLYESAAGDISNGAGNYFFAGKTGSSSPEPLRRGLLQFDLSSIPASSIITDVTLTLYLSNIAPAAPASIVSLYTVNASWGEGASISNDPEGSGNGGAATAADATWLYRFFGGQTWTNPGGDFGSLSASTTVSAKDVTYGWTGPGMVAAVQAWVNNGATNNGWMVRGDEAVANSAKRFNSRTNSDLATRPKLTVTFSAVPEPSATGLLALCGAMALSTKRRWHTLLILLTTAGAAQAQTAYLPPITKDAAQVSLETFATGLVSPLTVLSAPGDTSRQFIVEQTGQIRIVQNGAVQPTPFLNVSARLPTLTPTYDERGLLGVAFDPGFDNPVSPGYHRIFTYNSEPIASGTPDLLPPVGTGGQSLNHHGVIASWRVDTNNANLIDPTSRIEVLRFGEPQGNHNGGQIAFGPDGYLYFGLGDGGSANDTAANGHNPTIGNGQDAATYLGKILRIDVNGTNSANGRYGIPSTNPFAAGGGLAEIYAVGFRNPYSFSFNGTELLVADVGQNNIEELDRVTLGGPGTPSNYGWRYKEGTFKFNTNGTITSDLTGVPGGLIDPILQYDHTQGISITGGFVYHGTLLPDLAGKYIFGDFSTSFSTPLGRLFYADLDTGAINEFVIAAGDPPLGLFVKGFGQDANGEIYLTASTSAGPSGTTGQVIKLVPEPGASALFLSFAAGLALTRRRRIGSGLSRNRAGRSATPR